MSHPFPSLTGVASTVLLALAVALPSYADDTATIDPTVAQATRGIAADLVNQLGQRLKAALSADGPVAAVSVCKEAAPSIARGLSAQHGAQITRVGTRVRNPNMGVPNGWQKEALAEFETRLEKGDKPGDLEYWKVVERSDGQRELRYAKAIVTQQLCVTCHGKPEDIPAPLMEKIRAEYPADQATGYSVGKLRGAVVVTRPM
jgi:hypothetical protein